MNLILEKTHYFFLTHLLIARIYYLFPRVCKESTQNPNSSSSNHRTTLLIVWLEVNSSNIFTKNAPKGSAEQFFQHPFVLNLKRRTGQCCCFFLISQILQTEEQLTLPHFKKEVKMSHCASTTLRS